MSDDPSLYLILHRVRGEPAFDVAQKATYGSEEGWCLCTCGHRAFPFKWWNLDDLVICEDGYTLYPSQYDSKLPADWPDHYSINDKPSPKKRMEKKLESLTDTELEAVLALIQSKESEL